MSRLTSRVDPLSQAVLGAGVAHAIFGRKLPVMAAVIGAAAGMSPDLDILIPTLGDPTAGWVWHRGPTHSVAWWFFGGPLAALPFLLFKRLRKHWKAVVGAATVGVATHAPLDALTSYGTQMLWPFADSRIALDWMPIIDPLWTLPFVLLVVLAVWRKSTAVSSVAVGLSLTYIGFGAFQHSRALAALEQIAAQRGQTFEHPRAMPAPGALAVWHGIYKDEGMLETVGLRTGYFSGITYSIGEPRQLVTADDLDLREGSRAQHHFDVFRWFSQDTLYRPDPQSQPDVVADGRYSSSADQHRPLWGLDFSGGTVTRFDPSRVDGLDDLLRLTFSHDPEWQELAND